MAGFLYYFPNLSGLKIPDAVLEAAGLLDVTGASLSCATVNGGPDGGSGVIAVVSHSIPKEMPEDLRPVEPQVGYYPDKQVWRKCAGKGKEAFWLGYEKDNPPRALDLRRDSFTGNNDPYIPVLRKDEYWSVPKCKCLPSYIGLDDEGEPQEVLQPQYRALQQMADKAFRDFCYKTGKSQEPSEDFTLMEQYQLALGVLQLNYHLGKWEADTLGLMTKDNCFAVVYCFIDAPGYSGDEEKKKDA